MYGLTPGVQSGGGSVSGAAVGLLLLLALMLGSRLWLRSQHRRHWGGHGTAGLPAARQAAAASRSRLLQSELWAPTALRGFLRKRGFLSRHYDPATDRRLRHAEDLVLHLPDLVSQPPAAIIAAIETLPTVDLPRLQAACESDEESETLAERVFFLYAFLSYAYLRAREQYDAAIAAPPREADHPMRLPRVLAVPWHEAATYVDRTPQLDYVVTVQLNIEPFDDIGVTPPVCYTSTSDERYFYRLHARIELAAAPAVGGMLRALAHTEEEKCASVTARSVRPSAPYPVCCYEEERWSATVLIDALQGVTSGLHAMAALMPRMSEGCSPKVFHAQIRTPLSSFARPVAFDGVDGTPLLELGGASGAQSAILPAVDAFLGISHSGPHELAAWSPSTTPFLRHLPPAHREFIRRLRQAAPGAAQSVRTIMERLRVHGDPTAAEHAERLRTSHADCLEALKGFRKAHMALVREFIISPALDSGVRALSAKLEGGPGGPTGGPPGGPTRVAGPEATTSVAESQPSAAPSAPARPASPSLARIPSSRSAASSSAGTESPVDVRNTFVGTGGSHLMSFLSGRLLDTGRASVSHLA